MKTPTATYRFQLNSSFTFEDLDKIADYLSRLGISDIYASPIFTANPESSHGYDMTDPTSLNPELGTEQEFKNLVEKLRNYNITWLQDFVPNHMGFSSNNNWLMDVFEFGPLSPYYHFFDILWNHPDPDLNGKVLTPVLGSELSDTIQKNELKIKFTQNGFSANYYQHRFPLNIQSLTQKSKSLNAQKIVKIFDDCKPPADYNSAVKQKQNIINKIKTLPQNIIDDFTATIQNDQNIFISLMQNQNYCLAYWKTVAEKINYRRFFYINDLICLNIHQPDVFKTVHSKIKQLIDDELITGLRIDHLDGLRYPVKYLRDLRNKFPDLYIIVEKILAKDENIPSDWPIQGTTGYDFTNYSTALFCKHENKKIFLDQYNKFIGEKSDYHDLLYRQKKMVISNHLSPDIENLLNLLKNCENFKNLDFTHENIKKALISLTSSFNVYRTYIENDYTSQTDRKHLELALSKTIDRNPEYKKIIDYIRNIFMDNPKTKSQLDFITRFQQLTAPAMAKGFEDTLLYIYHPLASQNEVGSMPNEFGIHLDEFHNFNRHRLFTKKTLNTTSTHDTKRGEDIRARLNVLSEIPESWFEKVKSWQKINSKHKTKINANLAPAPNDEYLIYQTILAALPPDSQQLKSFTTRIKDYITKALREAKVHTNWITPNTDYENAATKFAENLLNNKKSDFWKDFSSFQKTIAEYGIINASSQTLLKMTAPGIPDFYQGTENWDLNLVDPDNRRPVDFKKLNKILKKLQNPPPRNEDFIDFIFSNRNTGLLKLFIIKQTLTLRKKMPRLFTLGDYLPLKTCGTFKDNIIAFARQHKKQFAIIIAPRFVTGITQPGQMPLNEIWKDTRVIIPGFLQQKAKDIFTRKQTKLKKTWNISQCFQNFFLSLICNSTQVCDNENHECKN